MRWAIDHRYAVLLAAAAVLAAGVAAGPRLKTAFFPKDLSYLFYIDVWTPEDSSLSATNRTTVRVAEIVQQTAAEFEKEHPHGKKDVPLLKSVSTFVGGSSPRWWYSLLPEQSQLSYGNVIVELTNNHVTQELVGPLQTALDRELAGARCDVRQVETGKPVELE